MSDDLRTFSRDVDATLIPKARPEPAGRRGGPITHRLGGNFTVMTANGMFRTSGANQMPSAKNHRCR